MPATLSPARAMASTATPPAAPNPITTTSTGFRVVAIVPSELNSGAQNDVRPGLSGVAEGLPQAGERAEQVCTVGVVNCVGQEQLRMLEGEVVPFRAQSKLETLANGPGLGKP